MPRARIVRWTLAGLLLLVTSAASRAGPVGVTLTPVNNPIWRPTDFHLFSAPADSFNAFLGVGQSLLPPPNHQFHPNLGIGPGAPHAGPYTSELAAGMIASGFQDKTVFTPEEFSGQPLGIYLVWMNVPDPGTTGSSPDFMSGPIIPNSLFPIDIDGDLFRNGQVIDPFFDFPIPALDNQLNPPFNVDGHSHFPVFFAEILPFLPPGTDPLGSYEYQISMRDQQGRGWNFAIPFQIVTPEPSSLVFFGVGVFGLFGYKARRKGRGSARPA